MLVASYHGILRPKQDQMLSNSSGIGQNILKHHIYIVYIEHCSKKMKRQSTLSLPPTPSKILGLAPSEQNPAPATTQSNIPGKFKKKHLKQGSLNDFLKVAPLAGEISNRNHVKAKGFCLSSTGEPTGQFLMKPLLKCMNMVMKVRWLPMKM